MHGSGSNLHKNKARLPLPAKHLPSKLKTYIKPPRYPSDLTPPLLRIHRPTMCRYYYKLYQACCHRGDESELLCVDQCEDNCPPTASEDDVVLTDGFCLNCQTLWKSGVEIKPYRTPRLGELWGKVNNDASETPTATLSAKRRRTSDELKEFVLSMSVQPKKANPPPTPRKEPKRRVTIAGSSRSFGRNFGSSADIWAKPTNRASALNSCDTSGTELMDPPFARRGHKSRGSISNISGDPFGNPLHSKSLGQPQRVGFTDNFLAPRTPSPPPQTDLPTPEDASMRVRPTLTRKRLRSNNSSKWRKPQFNTIP
ncbi:hypothetical protein EDC01DRAFT_24805 [Geopyxis carbonaria]|nr:hypothetical protein EDC01DRAFT_24805 [Geopyxis carbonaria]